MLMLMQAGPAAGLLRAHRPVCRYEVSDMLALETSSDSYHLLDHLGPDKDWIISPLAKQHKQQPAVNKIGDDKLLFLVKEPNSHQQHLLDRNRLNLALRTKIVHEDWCYAPLADPTEALGTVEELLFEWSQTSDTKRLRREA